jgi:tensin
MYADMYAYTCACTFYHTYIHSTADVVMKRSYWYKPDFSRDAASERMMKSQPGYFIVRDSSTVTGGYALTIRVSEEAIRAKLKLPPDIVVTNDMCVKHFLIQPDAQGVRLQGWSEPPFSKSLHVDMCGCHLSLTLPPCLLPHPPHSPHLYPLLSPPHPPLSPPTPPSPSTSSTGDLEEFILQHCQERYCLPIVLTLPTSDLESVSHPHPTPVSAKVTKRSQPQEQAATDLIYLGMVDVSNPGSESVIASVAEQLKSLQLTKANVVNFKASKEGLTVTDTVSGSFVKRFHPLQSISYCGLDPSDTRWEFDGLQFRGKAVSVKKARSVV